ncbi:hypothetical protein [Azospirillum himalayense]|uniref:Uncharacterized protein n=1 Tax=Azospirillum himalayense TaxID=654847 RepID=A0ABW0GCX7_9PROT
MTTQSDLRAINGDIYNGSTNPGGLDGPGGMEANFPRALGLIAQGLDDMATYLSQANFLAAQASVATILQLCQALVAQITMGSTTALAFPGVDKLLLSTPNVAQVFVYDTRLDDRLLDGSRWNEPGRCSSLSYWHEAPGTYAGVKRDVPAVVALTVLQEQWFAHDALDLDPVTGVPRLWRASNPTGNGLVLCGPAAPITCVFGLNGYIYIGSGMGLHVISLTGDWCDRYDNSGRRRRLGTFAQRNTVLAEGATSASGALVATSVNAVHARVLPGAPLDAAGLPIPTVAVATSAGVSVIHPNGVIANITGINGIQRVFLTDKAIFVARNTNDDGRGVHYRFPIPYANIVAYQFLYAPLTSYPSMLSGTALHSPQFAVAGDLLISGKNVGLSLLVDDYANPANGMVAYITKDYATGWQPGDIRLATLCDGATGAITGGQVADRSYKNKPLTVYGTLARNPVAVGAEMMAWSGFSASNYLEQPYNADLDYAGDFFFAAWANFTVAGGMAVRRGNPGAITTGPRVSITGNGAKMRFTANDGTTGASVDTADIQAAGWHLVLFCRRGATLEAWTDGGLSQSAAAPTGTLANAAAVTRIGCELDGTNVWNSLAIALLRSGAYAPTPAQIRKMFADEAPLMQDGARCLLGGTSNIVTALGRCPLTGRVPVGTGDGVSIFSGLRRVSYLDEVVLAATTSDTIRSVSLCGGTLLIGTAAEVGVVQDAIGGKEAILAGGPRPVGGGFTARGVTTDATPLDLAPRILVGERETVQVEARIIGRVVGAADTERLSYVRKATYYRDGGGNVTLQGSVQTIGTDTEVTSTADATLQIDTAAQTVAVRVTGVASKRIAWSASIIVNRSPTEETSYAA